MKFKIKGKFLNPPSLLATVEAPKRVYFDDAKKPNFAKARERLGGTKDEDGE